jgi:hypothetical protein
MWSLWNWGGAQEGFKVTECQSTSLPTGPSAAYRAEARPGAEAGKVLGRLLHQSRRGGRQRKEVWAWDFPIQREQAWKHACLHSSQPVP